MKLIISILFLVSFVSCSTKKEFIKENVCSPTALSYIKGAKGRSLNLPQNPLLTQKLKETQAGMQQCYEQYMRRTGVNNFRTCLVVGVDEIGRMEYYNFSSQDIHSDQAFIQCAVKITKKIPYWTYGSNYILLQTYNFYGE